MATRSGSVFTITRSKEVTDRVRTPIAGGGESGDTGEQRISKLTTVQTIAMPLALMVWNVAAGSLRRVIWTRTCHGLAMIARIGASLLDITKSGLGKDDATRSSPRVICTTI